MAKTTESIDQFFEVQVPETLSRNSQKARQVNGRLLFEITGAEGGAWTIDLSGKTPVSIKGKKGKPEFTVEISKADLERLRQNPALGPHLVAEGKLKFTGNPILLAKIATVFITKDMNAEAGAIIKRLSEEEKPNAIAR